MSTIVPYNITWRTIFYQERKKFILLVKINPRSNGWQNQVLHNTQEDCRIIFFDPSKTYSTLPDSHRGEGWIYHWLTGYISGRQQRVVLNGVCSQSHGIPSRVQRGSFFFWPLAIHLEHGPPDSDFPLEKYITGHVFWRHYAHKPISSNLNLVALQSDVMNTMDWVETIDLWLNKEKCMRLRGIKLTSARP